MFMNTVAFITPGEKKSINHSPGPMMNITVVQSIFWENRRTDIIDPEVKYETRKWRGRYLPCAAAIIPEIGTIALIPMVGKAGHARIEPVCRVRVEPEYLFHS